MQLPDHPLDEDEILHRYGDLLWRATIAFGEDLRYVVEMCETANLIEYKRDVWRARHDAPKLKADGETVEEAVARLVRERGIVAPRRTS